MKIKEITQGKTITISMIYKNEVLKTEATVLTPYSDGILITPIVVGGKIIDGCTNAKFEYVDTVTGKAHLFTVDSIRKLGFNGSNFHFIRGREAVLEDTQNVSQRYEVKAPGLVHINNMYNSRVIVRSVSLKDMVFMTGGLAKYRVGDKVRVVFQRNKLGSRVDVIGRVGRVFKTGGHEAAELALTNFSKDYVSFVMDCRNEADGNGSTGISA